MKKFLVALAVVLGFSSASVEAFTEPEKDSLRHFALAWIDTFDAMSRAASSQDQDFQAFRQEHADALADLALASRTYTQALDRFFNSPDEGFGVPRDEQIADAFKFVNSVLSRHANTVADLNAIPSNPDRDAALAHVNSAIAHLNAMDRSLGYLEWQPPSFPNSVGPHGDYLSAESALGRVGKYFAGHWVWDTTRYFDPGVAPITTAGATDSFVRAVQKNSAAGEFFVRSWIMDGDVVLDDDRVLIEAQEAAGTGLRPFAFFRLLQQVKYLAGKSYPSQGGIFPNVDFAGQPIEGMPQLLHAANKSVWEGIVALNSANGPQWAFDQITPCGITVGDPATCGRVFAGSVDLSDFWMDIDSALSRWILFIHQIVGPPGGGGGGGLTCGAGTHEESGVCVADPVTCPLTEPSPSVVIDGVPVVCVPQ